MRGDEWHNRLSVLVDADSARNQENILVLALSRKTSSSLSRFAKSIFLRLNTDFSEHDFENGKKWIFLRFRRRRRHRLELRSPPFPQWNLKVTNGSEKNTSERVFRSVRRRTKKTIFLYWLTFCRIVSCCWCFGDEFALIIDCCCRDYPQGISAQLLTDSRVWNWRERRVCWCNQVNGDAPSVLTRHESCHRTQRDLFSKIRTQFRNRLHVYREWDQKNIFFYLFSWFVAENWITKKGSLYYFHCEYLRKNGAHPLILLSLW